MNFFRRFARTLTLQGVDGDGYENGYEDGYEDDTDRDGRCKQLKNLRT